jgi:8-oxo-dGTP diphosphatase
MLQAVAKHVSVVGAVIIRDGLVLCARRGGKGPLAGKWEFPGGKVEEGEKPEAALRREIDEELRCQLDVGPRVAETTYEYDFATVTLTTYRCELVSGTPQLTEHTELAWLPPAELDTLDWAPADLPSVKLLMSS